MKMLWYKYWLDSRWVFVLVPTLVILGAVFILALPDDAAKWVANLQRLRGWSTTESPDTLRSLNSYQGVIWAVWFKGWMLYIWPLLAVALGLNLILPDSPTGGSGLAPQFGLSLPVTRRRLLTVGAMTHALELGGLALGSSLVVPLLASLSGRGYSVADAVVYALLITGGSLVFLSLAFLLINLIGTWWLAGVIAVGVTMILYLSSYIRGLEVPRWNFLYRTMSGESYFLNGEVPWAGLFITLVLAAAIFYLAVRLFERRDF
jgi:hypothetical protein